jgi:proprotein convertase subtilisin/kexin type 5
VINPFATNSSNTCVTLCPSQLYNNSGTCSYCISPCLTCINQTACISCINNYILSNNQCLSSCSSGQYVNVLNNIQICTTCVYPCSTCSTITLCLSCSRVSLLNLQTYYYNNSCKTTCPSGYYS